MKNQTNSQRVLRWLADNKIPLGALTSTDTKALRASVEIAELICHCGLSTARRDGLLQAWGAVVRQMQLKTRFMAFHGVAMVWDWSYRAVVWDEAGMDDGDLKGKPDCAFGPQRERLPFTAGRVGP